VSNPKQEDDMIGARAIAAVGLATALAGIGLTGAQAGTRPAATRTVASAHGASHFTLTYVFGLQKLVLRRFGFHVQIHADGSVAGDYSYSDVEDGVPFTASGPVTCAVIRGNRVWVGGTVTASNDPTQIGADSWWQAADDGHGHGTPDMTTLLGLGTTGQAQAYCDTAPDPRFPWPVARGAIHVSDHRTPAA
jgi:hypothetical protein